MESKLRRFLATELAWSDWEAVEPILNLQNTEKHIFALVVPRYRRINTISKGSQIKQEPKDSGEENYRWDILIYFSMTLLTNCICNDPISKSSHIVKYWGLELQDMNFFFLHGEGHNIQWGLSFSWTPGKKNRSMLGMKWGVRMAGNLKLFQTHLDDISLGVSKKEELKCVIKYKLSSRRVGWSQNLIKSHIFRRHYPLSKYWQLAPYLSLWKQNICLIKSRGL